MISLSSASPACGFWIAAALVAAAMALGLLARGLSGALSRLERGSPRRVVDTRYRRDGPVIHACDVYPDGSTCCSDLPVDRQIP